MARVNKDDNPYKPDRAVIYALSKPKVSGETVTGDGGAFRSKGKCYRYSFTCKTTPDRMRVLGLHLQDRPAHSRSSMGKLRPLSLTPLKAVVKALFRALARVCRATVACYATPLIT